MVHFSVSSGVNDERFFREWRLVINYRFRSLQVRRCERIPSVTLPALDYNVHSKKINRYRTYRVLKKVYILLCIRSTNLRIFVILMLHFVKT